VFEVSFDDVVDQWGVVAKICSAGDEFPGTIANKAHCFVGRKGGQSEKLESVIAGVGDVWECVEKSTVKVESNGTEEIHMHTILLADVG